MALPYDTVGHIIDILAAEGGLTPVKNASLASSSVLHLCRKHIFRIIPLYTLSHQSRFISLLANNPAIVQYIRELDYGVHQDHAQLSPVLPNLLQKISHLERLRITTPSYSIAEKLDWIQIDPLLRSALLRLMHLPTLTHLEIEAAHNLPISAFAPCRNLKHLDILRITVTPSEDLELNQIPSIQINRSPTPRILHFRIYSDSQIAVGRLLRAKWKDGHPVLDFSHLKTLDSDFEMFNNVQITRELSENIRHLEELRIRVSTQSVAGLSEMISNARKLRTLDVKAFFKGRENHSVVFTTSLCEELQALSGNTVLQVLKFTLFFRGRESKTEIETGFKKLEEVLMNPGWSTLKCVYIEIGFMCSSSDAEKLELKSVPEMYLSRLSTRGILDYNHPDWNES